MQPGPVALAVATLVLGLAGCSSAPPTEEPELDLLYSQAARFHDAERNPIIVVPGILGSKLLSGEGQVVWGAFEGDYADPETPAGARLFGLPLAGAGPLREARDAVEPDGALETLRVSLLGLPLQLDAYIEILKTLGVGGYRDQQLGLAGAIDYGSDHYTCFQFDYDWRRDNVENAQRLAAFIAEKRAFCAAERLRRFGSEAPVKFDIIAHSMGGLVTRYFLRYGDADLPADGGPPEPSWAGAEHVERVILVGTPSAGSANALLQLVEGVQFAPVLPSYAPALVGTLPSVYQLLPRARHGALVELESGKRIPDLLDARLWIKHGWGLANPAQDPVLAQLLPELSDPAARRRHALDSLRGLLARARRFQEALDLPSAPPPGTELLLVAGDAVPTPAVVAVDHEGEVTTHATGPGDGTVLRSSALLDERVGGTWEPRLRSPIRWSRVQFVFSDHLGMTRDPVFSDNVLYLLLEDPRLELGPR